ncbi:MAG: hemoglobin-like flavoprotein [Pirellulaceae bacterium]|jgi:hemoglobin-like flavoprotein
MTPEQKELVQTTWKMVEPISETAAELFYGRLLELNPDLKSLFKGDMAEQGKKLMQMLATCLAGLDNLESLTPAVEALGRRHVDYEVDNDDYATVGEALLWTLEKGLGDASTPEVEEA